MSRAAPRGRTHGAGARHAQQGDAALELLAEELRLAHQNLCRSPAPSATTTWLGEIFGRFCIGK
jgi:tRNA modification GTPase